VAGNISSILVHQKAAADPSISLRRGWLST